MRLDTEYVMKKYQHNLYLAAFSVLENSADAQDAVQMTLIKYHRLAMDFENEEHTRKWLFKTLFNQAKDLRRSFFRRRKVSLDSVQEADLQPANEEDRTLFDAVCSLPAKERVVLQLYYYENYTTKEMSELLGLTEAAVRKRLSRARTLLKDKLKGDWDDENE